MAWHAPITQEEETDMNLPSLRTVTRTQGNNAALKDGSVRPRSFSFDFVEVEEGRERRRRGLVRGRSDYCGTLYWLGEGLRVYGTESGFGWKVLLDCARRMDGVV